MAPAPAARQAARASAARSSSCRKRPQDAGSPDRAAPEAATTRCKAIKFARQAAQLRANHRDGHPKSLAAHQTAVRRANRLGKSTYDELVYESLEEDGSSPLAASLLQGVAPAPPARLGSLIELYQEVWAATAEAAALGTGQVPASVFTPTLIEDEEEEDGGDSNDTVPGIPGSSPSSPMRKLWPDPAR